MSEDVIEKAVRALTPSESWWIWREVGLDKTPAEARGALQKRYRDAAKRLAGAGLLRQEDADAGRAEATLARIREAVAGHPQCDVHPDGDPITCGWKAAYASVVAALEGTREVQG